MNFEIYKKGKKKLNFKHFLQIYHQIKSGIGEISLGTPKSTV